MDGVEAAQRVLFGDLAGTARHCGSQFDDNVMGPVPIELRNALGAAVGRTLPASLVYDCPTIEALASHLLDIVEPAAAEPAAVAAYAPAMGGPEEPQAESIDGLSQEQLAALLADRLATLGKDLT